MSSSIAGSLAAAALSLPASVLAQPGPPPQQHQGLGKSVSFVTCPEFRDTPRQCWVAEHGGKTYYIGGGSLGTQPQLLHRVLVQGTAYDGEESCGGVNVDPIAISVLPEVDYQCNTVLPDNGAKPREGSRFDVPSEILSKIGAEQPPTKPLEADESFVISFGHDSTFLNQHNQQAVEGAAKAAIASKAKRVTVTGYAATSRLEDGSTLTESISVAQRRAELVKTALISIGVDPKTVQSKFERGAIPADGIHDSLNRKVVVSVQVPRR